MKVIIYFSNLFTKQSLKTKIKILCIFVQMKPNKILLFLFLLLFLFYEGRPSDMHPKDTLKPLIQFSGVVITGDSLIPIPFAGIRLEGTSYAIMANYDGYFNFAARPGSVIIFSAIGFKPARFEIPDTLTSNRYSWIQMLQNDTILLKLTVIYPWANIGQLEQAIIDYRVPDGDFERAMKNLYIEEMKERAINLPMDGSMNYRNQVQNIINKSYYNGQYMPNNLLNPFAWQKFFEAWKNGDFKKK